ncbi:hypothetical protein KSX_76850 [Ktedonospora formicarum]|uniref:Uncharacterized protein n=1 Tax=Ktedonospora formicarum TaxID=2778364 RepID=A0A8J3IBB9_9CHLR|nr:hypothetical protein KSX_76850 [Ktedonospora formicarum]
MSAADIARAHSLLLKLAAVVSGDARMAIEIAPAPETKGRTNVTFTMVVQGDIDPPELTNLILKDGPHGVSLRSDTVLPQQGRQGRWRSDRR